MRVSMAPPSGVVQSDHPSSGRESFETEFAPSDERKSGLVRVGRSVVAGDLLQRAESVFVEQLDAAYGRVSATRCIHGVDFVKEREKGVPIDLVDAGTGDVGADEIDNFGVE
jgi:GTP cyclohydrolase II